MVDERIQNVLLVDLSYCSVTNQKSTNYFDKQVKSGCIKTQANNLVQEIDYHQNIFMRHNKHILQEIKA